MGCCGILRQGSEGGRIMNNIDRGLLHQLIRGCAESERQLYDAAQWAQNRGVKVILKSYAQQHKEFAVNLTQFAPDVDQALTLLKPRYEVSRGWNDLWAGITVRRQRRQQIAINHALAQEEILLHEYEKILDQSPPFAIESVIREQETAVRDTRDHLALMAAPDSEQTLMVRLFEDAATADRAVAKLKQAGIASNAVYQIPVKQVEVFEEDAKEQTRTRWETVLASMIFGGTLGALLSVVLIVGKLIYFPDVGGFLLQSPLGASIEMLVIGLATGALFALFAGLLISEGEVEDDTYFYEQSLSHGTALVAVYTSPAEHAEIEEILGIEQQFEVEPQLA